MELRCCLVLLFLGIIWRNIPQIGARENQVTCNKSQILSEEFNICCDRCPPGHYRKEKCSPSIKTVCLPCSNGTYSSAWSYASVCRHCFPCKRDLVEKEPCSSTRAAVCVCPDGYSCTMEGPLNECQICEPTTPTVPEPTERPPDMTNIWIIVGVLLFLGTAFLAAICLRTPLLKSFGDLIKNKRSSESVPQVETPVDEDIEAVHKVHGGPAFPLLQATRIKTPSQEENYLPFPVQVEDTTQNGEFAN